MPSINHLQDSKRLPIDYDHLQHKNFSFAQNSELRFCSQHQHSSKHPCQFCRFQSTVLKANDNQLWDNKLGIHKDVASVNRLEKQGKFQSPETPFKRLAPMMHPYAHSLASYAVKDT